MSHLRERSQKNCLNCNALLYGRYCHVCGQENTEPAESLWHLVVHFFNDITHFDGKFFSTFKLLLFKPGFLSAEYQRGRRASYLNPVRMYVFTSFVFFLFFFTVFNAEEPLSLDIDGQKYKVDELLKMDSVKFAAITAKINKDAGPMNYQQFNNYLDSINSGANITFIGKRYHSKAQFDSMINTGAINPGWLERKLMYRQFEISQKYRYDKRGAMNSVQSTFIHMFPQILFVSLPLFAFVMWLLYLRHNEYYFVSHGIYSVHLYIFYFFTLLCIMGLQKLESAFNWDWVGFFSAAILCWLFIYEYKAMRRFYGQGRAKTFLKFLIAVIWRFAVFIILAILFLLLSIFKI